MGQSVPERVNQRNGYRHRDLDRVGAIDVAVPKLRTGTCFPEWLLERRKRDEAALTGVPLTPKLPPSTPALAAALAHLATLLGHPGRRDRTREDDAPAPGPAPAADGAG